MAPDSHLLWLCRAEDLRRTPLACRMSRDHLIKPSGSCYISITAQHRCGRAGWSRRQICAADMRHALNAEQGLDQSQGGSCQPFLSLSTRVLRQGWLFRAVDPRRAPRHFWGFKRQAFTVHGMRGPHRPPTPHRA